MRIATAEGTLILLPHTAWLILSTGQRLSVGMGLHERRRLIVQALGFGLAPYPDDRKLAPGKRKSERKLEC